MKIYCPNLEGVNTSKTPMTTFSGNVIKPDVTYYNISRPDKRATVESAELMVEAKYDDNDDPFEVHPTDKGLFREGDRPKQTLGQVTNYATAHLAAQFRTHIFSILYFRKAARLMRWDRAGVIVSERIQIDSLDFKTFFWRFNHASFEERGHDPTVTPFKFTKDLTKEFLFKQLQFEADPGKFKLNDINFFKVVLPREDNCYVIGKATYLGVASLASRATRSFKAWCLKDNRPVFLKDTWRILSGSLKPEHEIYGKLAAKQVHYIPTVHDYSDLEDHRTLTGEYQTPTGEGQTPIEEGQTPIGEGQTPAGEGPKKKHPWVCDTKLRPIRTLQHYRLVLKEIGRSLTSFEDLREVLRAMRCALQGKDFRLTRQFFY